MIKYDKILEKTHISEIRDLRSSCERREKHHGVVNWKLPKEKFTWILDLLGIEGKITGGNFWSSPNPFHVHTDTGRESEGDKPTYNIVIPLNFHPSFNTVIFDQTYNGDASHFMVGSIYNYWPDPVYNKRQSNYNEVEGMSNNELDKDFYYDYLTHLPYETVKHLTVAHRIPWQLGYVMQFSSEHLHCSSNFNATKEGVTILVNTDA